MYSVHDCFLKIHGAICMACNTRYMALIFGMHAVYLVFGATGGIGSELSRLLQLQPDAKLILSSRTESKLKELADSIGGGTPMAANVLDPKEVLTS